MRGLRDICESRPTDVNIFAWIIAASQQVRDRRNNDAQALRVQRVIEERRRNLPAVIASGLPVTQP